MRFDLITAENLHSVWPDVRPGLERVIEVGAVRWLPEDLFAHLRIKRAQLYLAFDGAVRRGFFITEFRLDAFTNEPHLNIWVLFAEPTRGEHCADIGLFVAETMDFIDGCARKVGAKWVAMDGRRGWERFLKAYYRPVAVKFERRISP